MDDTTLTETTKYKHNANPLQRIEGVLEEEKGSDDGKEFPGCGDEARWQRPKVVDGSKYKHLPYWQLRVNTQF